MNKIIAIFNKLFGYMGLNEIKNELKKQSLISTISYFDQKLLEEKYQNPLRLNKYEFQSSSQNGEDGIIHEIFNRIGTENKFFVEFGVGNGLENNSAYLLLENWSGLWIEADKSNNENIKEAFSKYLQSGKLILKEQFIYKDNLEGILDSIGAPLELDFLSVDIDGNDFWVWSNMKKYKPRVLCVEYNGALGPYLDWVMPYDESHFWNGSKGIAFGASMKSLEILGRKMGYSLVGCNLSGVNAFFVRNDLIKDNMFQEPFTSEFHFEKPLYFMEHKLGHKRVNRIFEI